VGLAVLLRSLSVPAPPEALEFALVFNLLPHTLAPLTALLYGSGMIQDEVEEQTLTYLLVRPLPRWALYLTKLAATLLTTSLLVGVGTFVLEIAIHAGTPELWETILPDRAPKMAALMALGQVGYCSLFGCVILFIRRSILVGVGYMVLIEGLLSNLDFVLRRLTVVYYLRVLALRWLSLPADMRAEWQTNWQLELTTAPGMSECVLTVLGASAVIALLSVLRFSTRQFAMKTPEES
jgi:ABC-2 type transport system permease protein